MTVTQAALAAQPAPNFDTDVFKKHVEIVAGAGGPKPRIVGSSIRVVDIVHWHEKQGQSVAEILARFPQLTAGDVHAALAYYWDNRDWFEWRIQDGANFAAEMQRRDPGPLAEKRARTARG